MRRRDPDCRVGEAAAAQQHLRSVCDDLAAQNAMLRNQLAAAAEALRSERATFQAELHALRQKVIPSLLYLALVRHHVGCSTYQLHQGMKGKEEAWQALAGTDRL